MTAFPSMPGILLAVALIGTGVFIFCILPIVLGLMALRQIDRSNGVQRGRGLALCAIVLGALGLLIVPVALVCAGTVRRSAARVSTSAAIAPLAVTAPSGGVFFGSSSGGQGGQGGRGGQPGYFGGSAGGNGGNGSVLPVPSLPPVITAPRSTAIPRPNASQNKGTVGESSADDAFGTNPLPTPATAPAPASKPNRGGSVGEQDIDN